MFDKHEFHFSALHPSFAHPFSPPETAQIRANRKKRNPKDLHGARREKSEPD
jgi:hypothetical protein